MQVHFNKITGVSDAIISMFMSKRSWTPELNDKIINTCDKVFDSNGRFRLDVTQSDLQTVDKWLTSLFKFGRKHITMLRFIDISCTVEGLHRGAQDDFDSHARRLENRIIRSSTRLSTFGNEKSDYYKNKILTTDEALERLHIEMPEKILDNGITYVKTINGYVAEEYKDNKDVLRGLYMLSIPSNFIFKCNFTEWSHIVKERDIDSSAAPELKEMVEIICSMIEKTFPICNKAYWHDIVN